MRSWQPSRLSLGPIIFLMCVILSPALSQTTDKPKVDKKTIQKIADWVGLFTQYTAVDISDKADFGELTNAVNIAQAMALNTELSAKLAQFRQRTFVNVYPKGLLMGDEWILEKLNEISHAQYRTLNAPYITAEVWFKPNADATSYIASIVFKSPDDKLSKLLAPINERVNITLTGKTFVKPRDAKTTINPALFAALDSLSQSVGSLYAPNIAIRYNEQLYLHNQTINVWQKTAGSIDLIAVDKNNQPLNGAVTWTNTASSNGSTAKYSISDIGLNRVEVKSGADHISILINVKQFSLDPTELLRKILLEVLTEKKKQAIADLATLRTDSAANATTLASLIAKLESENFPMENTGTSPAPLFGEPLKLKDTTEVMKSDRANGINQLRKRKKVVSKILSQLNVAAFADLVVKQPEQLKTLLDDLVKNSGQLIAQLIVNQPGKEEDGARSIVMDYLNKNMERLAGIDPAVASQQVLPLATAPPSNPPAFDPTKYLYISPQVQFAQRDAFVKQLEDTLNKRKNLYVFINYSQDISTSSYLQRAKGTKPKGLPKEAQYKVYTFVHMPGSVEEQVISDGGVSTESSSAQAVINDVLGIGTNSYSKYVLSVLRAIRNSYGKSQNLKLDAPPEGKSSFVARVTLETGNTYDLTLIFQTPRAFDDPIASKELNYLTQSGQALKGISIYNTDFQTTTSRILSIVFEIDENAERNIKTLGDYLFWKTSEGKNLTLFVSGFDLMQHKAMLGCAVDNFLIKKVAGKIIPVIGWADLVLDIANIGYVSTNNKYFIEDLKENILPQSCQQQDPYANNTTVSLTDATDYWGEIDDGFIYATGNAEWVYALGDNSIKTALTEGGFIRRMADGKSAAADMATKIKNGEIKLLKGAAIDVVCHSMGYAYALGMIDELKKQGYKIGWLYAIAPENPAMGHVPTQIEGIWQYGSQETDPFFNQDGIAPQKAIPGISPDQRVPIDRNAPQNFIQSHMIANYKWIFTKKPNQSGYVIPRKK